MLGSAILPAGYESGGCQRCGRLPIWGLGVRLLSGAPNFSMRYVSASWSREILRTRCGPDESNSGTAGVGVTNAVGRRRVEGIPATPQVRIEPVSLPRGGLDVRFGRATIRKLWDPTPFLPGAPVIIQGVDISEVHASSMHHCTGLAGRRNCYRSSRPSLY